MSNRWNNLIPIMTWLSLLNCALSGCAATTVPVAEGNKAQAVIVIPKDASESIKWAAEELQRDLRSLSGAEVPIAPEGQVPPDAAEKSWILVGGPGQNNAVKEAVGKGLSGFGGLENDGFVLKTLRLGKRPVVVAGGDSDAGTMYAVFELLEQMGVTFRLTGDIIPEQ
jgi:alpha-glucuronidase